MVAAIALLDAARVISPLLSSLLDFFTLYMPAIIRRRHATSFSMHYCLRRCRHMITIDYCAALLPCRYATYVHADGRYYAMLYGDDASDMPRA